MVDAVVSLCTTPLSMDQQEIDVLYAGAQKALSGPPGIAMISFSLRAVSAYQERCKQSLPSSYYMDLKLVADSWGTHIGSELKQ